MEIWAKTFPVISKRFLHFRNSKQWLNKPLCVSRLFHSQLAAVYPKDMSNPKWPSPKERLLRLREQMKKDSIDAFLQGSEDAHQSEYVADRDKRVAFISTFTGSAGTVVVTQKEALLWTDGRYFIQAKQQLSDEWTLMKAGLPETPSTTSWIAQNVKGTLGIDPYLTSVSGYDSLAQSCNEKQTKIKLLDNNPIDTVWNDNQPEYPQEKVRIHSLEYAGETAKSKIEKIVTEIKKNKASALIVTSLDSIAWLLNLRGNDIRYNPVFFSYVLITEDGECKLFIDSKKVKAETGDKEKKSEDGNEEVKQESVELYLKEQCHVSIHGYDELISHIKQILSNKPLQKIMCSSHCCNVAIWNTLPLENRCDKDSPIEFLKAIKNKHELNGMRDCHLRDGVAKTKFLAWIDTVKSSNSLHKHTECTFAEKLLSFRKDQKTFLDLSFETISSVGANGAIIHYAPTPDTCAKISEGMYLVDSGGQYVNGTTDVTRTTHLGKPTPHEKECFTRVLKGVIALSRVVFPYDTKGPFLDTLARMHLWQSGLDYRHGTGHGVGAGLNVHEGPIGFSASIARKKLFEYGLREGICITNEPGYYEEGKFGIRIENVMVVVPIATKYQFQDIQFYGFETITLVPIDRQLIDISLMNQDEILWLDQYHSLVFEKLAPFMDEDYQLRFLKQATAPLLNK
ncbi:aminopeptidase [Reticulomyxa filosa]|uniref:Aminopeptidase n=1 Tax=Reticulomyxa filosa TaxID=46433 RepID=X6NCC1_RETFI|nr:aminopeptidase [Reticulomyxa filosa]|eukprot:ETO22962.1 aminopeptidase [Reticulomyxa filosa]